MRNLVAPGLGLRAQSPPLCVCETVSGAPLTQALCPLATGLFLGHLEGARHQGHCQDLWSCSQRGGEQCPRTSGTMLGAWWGLASLVALHGISTGG